MLLHIKTISLLAMILIMGTNTHLQAQILSQNADETTITPGNSISCNVADIHTGNSYYRSFNLATQGVSGDYAVGSVCLGIELCAENIDGSGSDFDGFVPVQINFYWTTAIGAIVHDGVNGPSGMDASVDAMILGDGSVDGTVVEIPISGVVVPASATDLVIEIYTPGSDTVDALGNPVSNGDSLFVGSNTAGQTAPTFLAATNCGVTTPSDTGALGFPDMHMVLLVKPCVFQGGGQDLLTNSDFELPLGSTFFDVLGLPFTLDAWGAEVSTVVGPENGILPKEGTGMLRMNDDGLTVTQIVQRVDVSDLATLIDSGGACVNFSAFFNVPANASGAIAGINVLYIQEIPGNFNGNLFDPLVVLGQSNGSGTLDGDVSSWEFVDISNATIPAGTRSLLVQISYQNASLAGNPGYVDCARLCVNECKILKGDVNCDGAVNLLDVEPFVDKLSTGQNCPKADINCDGMVNLLDVAPFIAILNGG